MVLGSRSAVGSREIVGGEVSRGRMVVPLASPEFPIVLQGRKSYNEFRS